MSTRSSSPTLPSSHASLTRHGATHVSPAALASLSVLHQPAAAARQLRSASQSVFPHLSEVDGYDALGFTVIDTGGNGNCLFTTISPASSYTWI